MTRKLLWATAILVPTVVAGFVLVLTLDLNLGGHKANPLEHQQIAVLIHDPNINQFVVYPFAQYTNGRYKEITEGQIKRNFFIYDSQEVAGHFKVTNISRSQTFGCFEPEVGIGKETFNKALRTNSEYVALASKSIGGPIRQDKRLLDRAREFLADVARNAFDKEIGDAMKLNVRSFQGSAPKLEQIPAYDLDKDGVPEIIGLFSRPIRYEVPGESQNSIPAQTYTSKANVLILARFPQGARPEILFKWFGCDCDYPLNNATVLLGVIDVNNDEKDELIFRHSVGEVTSYLLYEFRGDKPVQVFSAGFGC